MKLLKRCLIEELKNPLMNVGRLYLLQCPRKIKKYGKGYPSYKTTRPISITGIYQKIWEYLLLSRIKYTVVENTSENNAGFKPEMQCQM